MQVALSNGYIQHFYPLLPLICALQMMMYAFDVLIIAKNMGAFRMVILVTNGVKGDITMVIWGSHSVGSVKYRV
jgi:hypothetical protein